MIDLRLGDCLELMKEIPDKSIDMILCDLPYGTTSCKWDVVIPFDKLWEQYKRIRKDNIAIVLFGSEPFSSYLRMSNIKEFKYDWVWNKKLAGNGILAKIQPLKIHEIIHVFSNGKCKYKPIMRKGVLREKLNNIKISEINGGDGKKIYKGNKGNKGNLYYPVSIIESTMANLRRGRLHPTQKPVALLEYLIKTYTLENQVVLDNCMGSGSTGVACVNTNRSFIGMEKDDKYFEISKNRIKDAENNLKDNLFYEANP